MRSLRLAVREFLNRVHGAENARIFGGDYGEKWVTFGSEVRRLGGVVVALVERAFPLFLVPTSRAVIQELRAETPVRVRWSRKRGWTITDTAGNVLFSFDLPPVLFYMYARSETLTRAQAVTLKEGMFRSLQALVFDTDQPRVVRFVPDPEWFEDLRAQAARSAEPLITAQSV